MATKRITIEIDDKPVEIELKSAKKADGIRRAELMLEATNLNESELRRQVAFFIWPTCVSAVKSPDWVRDMSLTDFIDKVDEAGMDLWFGEAFALNPQWKAGMKVLGEVMTDEAQKKISQSEPGSPKSMGRMKKKKTATSQPLRN